MGLRHLLSPELVVLVGVVAVCLSVAFPYFEQVRNANEMPRLMQAAAVVQGGEWAIDGQALAGLDPGPDVSTSPLDGRTYPNKPPGTTLLGLAAYSIEIRSAEPTLRGFTFWARILGGVLPTLVLVGFAFVRFERREGAGPATVGLLLYALATPAASYAHLFYGHQLAGCLLLVGTCTLLDARRDHSPWKAGLGGAVAGAAVAVEYGAAFAGLPIGIMLAADAIRTRDPRLALAGLGGALLPMLLLAQYQHAVFGSYFATGYHHAANPEFAAKHGQGLLGLRWPTLSGFHTHVTSFDAGLLWWSPILLFAGYGLAQLARGRGEAAIEARLFAGIFGLVLLLGTGLSFDGGWRVGPRYLVSALPFLIPGLVHVFGQVRDRGPGLVVFCALASWSVILNALAANLWPHLDLTNIHNPLSEVLLPLLRGGSQPYSVFWAMGLGGGAYVCVGLSLLAVGTAIVRYTELGYRSYLGIAAGFFSGAALLLTVYPQLTEPHPKGERNLKYIQERAWEPEGFDEGATRPLT